MNYKIKSLLYFICFAASAILCHALESEIEDNPSAHTIEKPGTDLEKIGPENSLTLLSYKEE